MPKGKNQAFVITILGALLALAIFTPNPQMHAAFLFTDWQSKFSCHFYHANLFHWAANAFAVWLMRPSPRELLLAYPLAIASVMLSTTPIVGFSAVLYAYIGMNIIRWNISLIDWLMFIVANLITLFMPNIATWTHFVAFALGITYYLIRKRI